MSPSRGLCARGLPGLSGVHLKADLTAAIRAFQRRNGFEPDGIITPDGHTSRALGGKEQECLENEQTRSEAQTTCQRFVRQLDRLVVEIDRSDREVRELERTGRSLVQRLSSLASRLDGILQGLGLQAPRDLRNLAALRRELDNLHEADRSEVQIARGLTLEI